MPSKARTTRDRLLPLDGDYPTGPIDVYRDDVAVALVGDQPRNGDGTFGFKERALEYTELVQHPDVPGVDRPWRFSDVAGVECGPERAEDERPGPTVFEWPDDPSLVWEVEASDACVRAKPRVRTAADGPFVPSRDPRIGRDLGKPGRTVVLEPAGPPERFSRRDMGFGAFVERRASSPAQGQRPVGAGPCEHVKTNGVVCGKNTRMTDPSDEDRWLCGSHGGAK